MYSIWCFVLFLSLLPILSLFRFQHFHLLWHTSISIFIHKYLMVYTYLRFVLRVAPGSVVERKGIEGGWKTEQWKHLAGSLRLKNSRCLILHLKQPSSQPISCSHPFPRECSNFPCTHYVARISCMEAQLIYLVLIQF